MKWPTFPLVKLAVELQPGFAQQPNGEEGGLPHLRTNNVSEEGHIDLSSIKTILPNREQREKYSLQPFDILFNNTNSPALVGKTALFEEKGEFLFSNHMTRIRVRPNLANPSYIARYLHWVWKTGGFRHMVTQWVSQAAINRTQLTRLHVPLPPPSEQHRIVEILDQADALRKKRAEADIIAERILPALFYKMFGDVVSNPKGWRVLKVAQVAEVQRGDFRHRPRTEPRFYGGQYPFIQINDVTSSRIIIREYTQTLNEEGLAISRLFPSGTVVLSIAATIAASGILGFESCFPDSLVGVKGKPNLTTQEFLLFYFRSVAPRLIAQAPQLAQKNINLQILNDLDIPLPPLELQKTFSLAVSELVSVSDREGSASEKLDILWRTMLNRAFSGRLTAKWREAHMKELLFEMEEQAKTLSEAC